MRYVQKNGRERGRLEGVGRGPFQEVDPITRAQVHKGKRDHREREDRRRKQRGWED
jgi:hypothetical protein